MPEIPKRLEDELQTPYDREDIIGFFVLYVLVVAVIPYLLSQYAPFEVFITYFANVDIVANLLAINFPDYFIKWYSVYNDTLRGYLSFNIIGVVALAGIFYFGLNVKERSKGERWAIMIVMSIVTWTLPTIGIPYMNYHIEQYLENHKELTPKQYNSYRLGITIALSLIFLKLEWMAISYIEKLKL